MDIRDEDYYNIIGEATSNKINDVVNKYADIIKDD